MKKIISFIKRPFRVQYRLTILYHGDSEPRHIYGTDRRILRRMARNTEGLCDYWTLYMSGPFGLSERQVDSHIYYDKV